ncbi:MAG: DUF87 domain-containing protein [candidate division KSB1 bacterium]|nr:DUF87 domain-containing protein [candidate division KSB1 bacterium]
MEQAYEKLGLFYLGKQYDPRTHKLTGELTLYESKDLTTHAVIVGMTGSGKTGLGLVLIEEALIDGLPVIAVDPKGDLTNLLLTFPDLRPQDFLPWVNPQEAAEKGKSVEDYAAEQAELWRSGLAEWHQSPERIRRLRESAEMLIYTPGSHAGLPVSLLRELSPPPASVRENPDALREKIVAIATSLMGLVGIEGDPLRSREHVFVANLVQHYWMQDKALTLPELIRAVQHPPFDQIGAFDIETFFPTRERVELSLRLNNLIASPGFQAWMEGEPLQVARLLYSPSGKPRATIFTLSHLSEAERMFFVSTLLSEIVTWVRSQPGTSSLIAMLYMDEVFGYLPPTANPPSKTPLLTLLKQARASGLGLVLATQNPVDLDYKALSNAGTWFIGRLQTERDKERLLEGLESAAATADFRRQEVDQILSGLGKRVFYLHNVHETQSTVFQTRWLLSYLRGPLLGEQIRTLMAPVKSRAASEAEQKATAIFGTAPEPAAVATVPMSPAGVPTYFVPARSGIDLTYLPHLLAYARVRYASARYGVDTVQEVCLAFPLEEGPVPVQWDRAVELRCRPGDLRSEPEPGASFTPLPAEARRRDSYPKWQRAFVQYVTQSRVLELDQFPELGLTSQPGESPEEFQTRVTRTLREKRDEAIEKVRAKYAGRIRTLEQQLLRAEQALEREMEQAKAAKIQTAVSFGTAVLGAFLGRRRVSTVSATRLGTALGRASRVRSEEMDVARAQERVAAIQEQLESLQKTLEDELSRIQAEYDLPNLRRDRVRVAPSSTGVAVELFGLGWLPFRRTAGGSLEPAF